MQNRTRMRIKCDHSRNSFDGPCPLCYGAHYLLMAQMQAIKNAQCEDSGLLYVCVFGAVKYLHPLLTEVLSRYQVVSHIIGNRRIEGRDFIGVSGVAEPREIRLGMILISVAEVLRHFDELDVFR